jgi:hypothetical protein
MSSGPSGSTARRTLEQAGAERALDRIARVWAKARARAWELIEADPAGFPGWRSREDAPGCCGAR